MKINGGIYCQPNHNYANNIIIAVVAGMLLCLVSIIHRLVATQFSQNHVHV